jgi:predicted NBD/HSP70 family sugar kinase
MRDVIAFDIGGTHMRCALVRGRKIIDMEVHDTPKTRKDFFKRFDAMVGKFNSSKVKGIGVGIAGPVYNGVVLDTPNLVLKKFDLKSYIKKKYKKRAGVANDADCFALAELKVGAKLKNFILITVGTGIGGGIVIDGKVYNGKGYGSEFGLMKTGKLSFEEKWRLNKKAAKKEFGKNVLFNDLVKKKSRKSDLILRRSASDLGKGIASLISIFDPEAVFIGGGIRESGNYFLNMIRKETGKNISFGNKKKIMWTTLDNQGLIGASLLV